jgi:hypothetical protein
MGFTQLLLERPCEIGFSGQLAQACAPQGLADGEFDIKTDKRHVNVSWQMTSLGQCAWADTHRILLEVQKSADERGLSLLL